MVPCPKGAHNLNKTGFNCLLTALSVLWVEKKNISKIKSINKSKPRRQISANSHWEGPYAGMNRKVVILMLNYFKSSTLCSVRKGNGSCHFSGIQTLTIKLQLRARSYGTLFVYEDEYLNESEIKTHTHFIKYKTYKYKHTHGSILAPFIWKETQMGI